MKKLTEIQIKNEISDMSDTDNIPNCILPGLDDFIDEWNRQARELTEKKKELLINWSVK